jgi:hypothetical protein
MGVSRASACALRHKAVVRTRVPALSAYNHRVWSLDIAGPIRLLVINPSRVTAWFKRKLGRALLRLHPEIGTPRIGDSRPDSLVEIMMGGTGAPRGLPRAAGAYSG